MGESPGKMYAVAIILTFLATVAVGLRFYARHIKRAGYSWDEFTIVPALVCFHRSWQFPIQSGN